MKNLKNLAKEDQERLSKERLLRISKKIGKLSKEGLERLLAKITKAGHKNGN
jgi:hypothetical protein